MAHADTSPNNAPRPEQAPPTHTAQAPPVLFARLGALGIVTLNRPKVVNALNAEMVELIQRQLELWAGDDSVGAVLVRGAGQHGLCAGGDIMAIYRDIPAGGAQTLDFWRAEYNLNAFIARYPKPYIALMDGLVLGGGIGISAHGSHRIVTERTRGGMPETTIGFAPDVGGTFLLANAPGASGLHAGLTGAHLDGQDLIHLGFADSLIPSSALAEITEELGAAPRLDGPAVAAIIQKYAQEPPTSALQEQQAQIDAAYNDGDICAIVHALEASATDFGTQTARTLRQKSPTSLAVTLGLIRAAVAGGTLEDALEREYEAGRRFLTTPDFAEGIRAQIVDKDRAPRWNPASVEELADTLSPQR